MACQVGVFFCYGTALLEPVRLGLRGRGRKSVLPGGRSSKNSRYRPRSSLCCSSQAPNPEATSPGEELSSFAARVARKIRVFVSGMAGVAPDPAPLHPVPFGHPVQLLPKLQVLRRPALPPPALGLPPPNPLVHSPAPGIGCRTRTGRCKGGSAGSGRRWRFEWPFGCWWCPVPNARSPVSPTPPPSRYSTRPAAPPGFARSSN